MRKLFFIIPIAFVVGILVWPNADKKLSKESTISNPLPDAVISSSPIISESPGVMSDEKTDLKSHTRIGGNFEIIKFNNGINEVDLNMDGVKDMVTMIRRENGTSPHPYSIYSFSVFKDKIWHAAIIWKGYKDNKDDDVLYYDSITTSEGADGFLKDVRLIKKEKSKPVLAIARRNFGESFADSENVYFHFYDLKQNTDGDWTSDYFYDYRDSILADRKYTDVNQAWEELSSKY